MMDPKNRLRRNLPLLLLLFAASNCFLQIAWFWRFFAHDITMDGINYIGLARHLLDGNFIASVHGYWSPLISWLIAASGLFTRDLALLAQLITLFSLLACMPLLYLLTFVLWRSHLAAALAVFWFSIARGIIAGAFATIQADFLFAACSLGYFVILIRCLRQGGRWNWFLLGTVHALAFLAKAFAMPWLSISTVLAVVVRRRSWRSAAASLVLAFLVPALVWFGWGETLKVKYGFFTAGYQLRANLMVDLRRQLNHTERGDPYPLSDVSYDKYMVVQTPPAGIQSFKVTNPALLAVILKNELHNVPRALKELVILLTPGGVLGLIVGLVLMTRAPASLSAERVFCWICMSSLITLIAAYGMLVFDARYILPITPVLMAIAAPFIVPSSQPGLLRLPPVLQKLSLTLLCASALFFTFYWASPFRTVDRNFQSSCRDAATLIDQHQPVAESLVSIGEGPYPEHGIGFEAGVYVAYLAGRHLLAMNSALPDTSLAPKLAGAVLQKRADAVVIWGMPTNRNYQEIIGELRHDTGATSDEAILDPKMGEVGRVLFFHR